MQDVDYIKQISWSTDCEKHVLTGKYAACNMKICCGQRNAGKNNVFVNADL